MSEFQDIVITIDGPAASGKTSVSRELARKLGMRWVSTGAFYRGLAYVAQQLSLNLRDENMLVNLVDSDEWRVEMDSETTRVVFRNVDVTREVSQEQVGTAASIVSQLPRVREKLLPVQRACAENGFGLIAEGRDCGSVVFPDAQIKFYLTARSEDRAQRRALEQGTSVDKIVQAQQKRDKADQQRTIAPLQIPQDSVVIDTSTLNLQEVVTALELKVQNIMGKSS